MKLYQFAEISKPVVMMADLSKPMSFDELAVKFVGVCHLVPLSHPAVCCGMDVSSQNCFGASTNIFLSVNTIAIDKSYSGYFQGFSFS